MNICITEHSIKNFMGLFNQVIPSLLNEKQKSFNDILKELFEITVDSLRNSDSSISELKLKEVVIQHLGIAVLQMNKLSSDPKFMDAAYKDSMSDFSKKIVNWTNKDVDNFQEMFSAFSKALSKGKYVASNVVRFNAVSLEFARTSLQLSYFDYYKGFKGNVNIKSEDMIYLDQAIQEILNGKDINFQFKLVSLQEIKDPSFVKPENISGSIYVLVPYLNNEVYKFKDKTPVFPFRQSIAQLEYTINAKVEAQKIIANNQNTAFDEKAVREETEKAAMEYVSIIDEAIADYQKGTDVFFKINFSKSNKGFVEMNRNKISYANTIRNIDTSNVVMNEQLIGYSHSLQLNGGTQVTLFQKTWLSVTDKEWEIVLHLLKEESPILINEDNQKTWNDKGGRNKIIQTHLRKYFPKHSSPVSFDMKSGKVVLLGKEISIKDLTIEDLKAAANDRSNDKLVSPETVSRNKNVEILKDVSLVKESGQWYRKGDKVYEVVSIRKGYGVEYKKDSKNSEARTVIDLNENKEVILGAPISYNQVVLDNSYTIAELNEEGELKAAAPYIAFNPQYAKIRENKKSFKRSHYSTEIVKKLGTSFENEAAMEWFKNNPLSKVIQVLYKKENHDKGPQFLASYMNKVITMYKGSEGVLLYHEAFHGFWEGILSESERNDIVKELRSASGSFKVTVLGKSKSVKFSEASLLELEEYLAEEFRVYATNKSKSVAQKSSKIKEFFDRILKALVDFFGKASYGDLITSGKYQYFTNKMFDDLYSGNFSTAKFNTELSIDEKFSSVEQEGLKLNIRETDVFLESTNSMFSFLISYAYSHHSSEDSINTAMNILHEMLFLNPNSAEYSKLQKELNSFNFSLPSGLNYSHFQNIENLETSLLFVKETYQEKLEVFKEELKSDPENLHLKSQVEFLNKIANDDFFGDISKLEDYINEAASSAEPSSLITLILRNSPFYLIANKDFAELVKENQQREEKENKELGVEDEISDEVFQFGADQYNSKVHELDALEEKTKVLLSTVPVYSLNGIGNIEVNSLGFPKLNSLKKMQFKVLTLLSNSVDAVEMNAKLKLAAHGTEKTPADKELAYIYKILGDINSPDADQLLWNDFAQSMNKYYTKSIVAVASKKNIIEQVETGELDEEGSPIFKEEIKSSSMEMYSGQIGQDIQFIKQNWKTNFQYILQEGGSPYVELDEQGVPYLNLNYLYQDFVTFNPKMYMHIDYKGDEEIGGNINGLPKLIQKRTGSGLQNHYMKTAVPTAMTHAFSFFKELGIDLVKDSRLFDSFVYGNKELKIDSGLPLRLIEHFEKRKSKVYNFKNDNTGKHEKDVNSNRIYKFEELFSEFKYDDGNLEPAVSGQQNALTNLMKLQYHYSNEGTFMIYTAEGTLANQMSYHSSLHNMATVLNKSNSYEELISTPGFEHFNIENNVQAQAYPWLKNMFNLHNPNSSEYGVRNKSITIDVMSTSGSKLIETDVVGNIEYSNDIGVSVKNSDETTKFLSDIVLTLEGKAVIPRSEAKSSEMIVVSSFYKRSTNEIRQGSDLALSYSEADKILEDDYKGSHLTDMFFDILAQELLRMTEIRKIQSGDELIFSADYLNHGSKFMFFDDIFQASSKKTKEFFEKLNIETIKDLEDALLDPKNSVHSETLENDLRAYYLKRLENLKKNKETVNIPTVLLNKAKLKNKAKNKPDVLTDRLLLTFLLNNAVSNLSYSSMFLLDYSNYDLAKEAYHKRIAGLISTGKSFRFDKPWLDYLHNSDSFATTRTYMKEKGLKPNESQMYFDGYINTAVINEEKISSVYAEHYREYAGINVKEYEKMKEADGQGWISFDMYRVLSLSSNEWSDKQEQLYRKIANGETISSDDVKTTFPVRKFQYYGPVQGTSENVRLSLMAFHKYSLAPLVPTIIKNTPLETMHGKMMEQGIGYVTMHSGSKLNSLSPVTFEERKYVQKLDNFYNKEREINDSEDFVFTKNRIHVRYLKNQLFLAEGYKGKIPIPTQITKISLIGLFDNGVPTDYLNEQLKESNIDVLSIDNIYNKLNAEKKTQSANVILPKDVDVEADGQGMIYTKAIDFWRNIVPEAVKLYHRQKYPLIVAFRGNSKKTFLENYKSGTHTIGNPFDFRNESGNRKEQGVSSTKKFLEWMLTGNNFGVVSATEEYRQAIIADIKLGKLSKSSILYYEEKGYATHATVLDYLINEHDWNTDVVISNEKTVNRKESWEALSESEKRKQSKHYDWYVRYKELLGRTNGVDGKIPKFVKEKLLAELGMTYNPETGIYEGDNKKLISYIKANLKDRDLIEEEIVSIIDPSTGELIPDLSFSLHAATIEKLLTILVDKRLRKIKVTGEALVQISGAMQEALGLDLELIKTKDGKLRYGSNQLRFYHLVDKDGNPITDENQTDPYTVKTMEVMISLQGSYKELLKLKHSDGKSIGVYSENKLNYDLSLERLNEMMESDKFRKDNEKALTFAGVRIPTQGANSLAIPTIKKFLPEYAGPVIILPSEIVAQSGSDFDIDKLFSMMKNFMVIDGKIEEIEYNDSITETEEELKKLYIDYSERIKDLREDLSDLYFIRKDSFEKINDITEDIKSQVMVELNKFEDVYKQRKELYGYIKAAEKNLWLFKEVSLEERNRLLDSYNSELEVLNNIIKQQEDRIKEELLNEIGFEKAKEFFEDSDKEIKAVNSELENLLKLKEDVLRKINGKSFKGLENELVNLFIERGTMVSNFKDLVTANTTEDTKGMADTILKEKEHLKNTGEFNKRQKIGSSEASGISPTEVSSYEYNLFKHQENFVGMDALGIAAVTSTFQAMFTALGNTFLQNDSTFDKAFFNARDLLIRYQNSTTKEKNTFDKAQIANAKKIVSEYLPKFILMNSNTIDGKNYIGANLNVEQKSISDLVSQMINGFVDVAADAWVFNIEGSKENTPTLLIMILMGIPLNDIVRLSVHPMVKKYNSLKKSFKGPFSMLDEDVSIADSGKIKEKALSVMEMIKDKFFLGMSFTEINNLNTVPFTAAELNSSSNKNPKDFTKRDVEMFAQYLHIEKIAEEMTQLSNITKFDTMKMSTVTEVKNRIKNTELYRAVPVKDKFFGNEVLDYLSNDSIVASRNNDNLISKLFDRQFGLRNNEVLTDLSLNIKKKNIPKGYDLNNVRNHFKNDFVWFLYQNVVYSGDTVTFPGTNGEMETYSYVERKEADVKIDKENKVIYYNPMTSLFREIFKEEYTYVRKYFSEPNSIKQFIEFTLYYESLLNTEMNIPIEEFEDKYFVFDRRGSSLKDIYESESTYRKILLQKAALFLTQNPQALFDSQSGLMPILNNLKDRFPELNNYSLVSDIRFNQQKVNDSLTNYNAFYPNLSSDMNLLKRYKENLGELQNHKNEWVRLIFNTHRFTHMAFMQVGMSRNVKNDFVRIGNPRQVQDALFASEVYQKINATLKQAKELKNKKDEGKGVPNFLILSQFEVLFNRLLDEGKYVKRYGGVNYIIPKLDFTSTVNYSSSVLDVKVTFVSENKATYTKKDFDIAVRENELESLIKDLAKKGAAFVLLPDTKIILDNSDYQDYFDRLLKIHLNVDNTGVAPKLVKRVKNKATLSGIDLGPVLESIKTDNSQVRYSMMAGNATKIVGFNFKFLNNSYVSSPFQLLKALKESEELKDSVNSKYNEFDTVWLFGDMSSIKKSYEGYSFSEHNQSLNDQFESMKPELNKLISSKATIITTPLQGFDTLAGSYLLDKGFIRETVYQNSDKFYKFTHPEKIESWKSTSYIGTNDLIGEFVTKVREQFSKEFLALPSTKKTQEVLRTSFLNAVNKDMRVINGKKISHYVRQEILSLEDSVEIGLGEFNIMFEQMLLNYRNYLKEKQVADNKESKVFRQSLENSSTQFATLESLSELSQKDKDRIVEVLIGMSNGTKTKQEIIDAINLGLKTKYELSLKRLLELKDC